MNKVHEKWLALLTCDIKSISMAKKKQRLKRKDFKGNKKVTYQVLCRAFINTCMISLGDSSLRICSLVKSAIQSIDLSPDSSWSLSVCATHHQSRVILSGANTIQNN